MSTEHDTTQPTSPGTESPGAGPTPGAAGEPEAPTGPGAPPPRAADAAKAYAAAEAQATPADGNGDPGVPPPAQQPESQAESPEDHERQLEHDIEELTAKAEKADEYLDLAKRTKADFENYRKRAAREAASAQERGIARLAKELLPAIDNLDRAVQAAEASSAPDTETSNGHATLVSGVKLVHADVLAALQRAGIARFEPRGEQFDPQRHEAIAQQPVEGAAPGTIIEVYQQGYMLGEVVIRPARVVVAG